MNSQPNSRGGSVSTDRSHDLIDAQVLAAPSPGEASRNRYEQVVHAHLSDAAGSGTPAEIDPEFAGRVVHAQVITTSPGMSVWDRRGGFMTEARRAEAQGLHTYDRLISQQVTRQAPEPVPVPQTVVRQTTR